MSAKDLQDQIVQHFCRPSWHVIVSSKVSSITPCTSIAIRWHDSIGRDYLGDFFAGSLVVVFCSVLAGAQNTKSQEKINEDKVSSGDLHFSCSEKCKIKQQLWASRQVWNGAENLVFNTQKLYGFSWGSVSNLKVVKFKIVRCINPKTFFINKLRQKQRVLKKGWSLKINKFFGNKKYQNIASW